MWVSYEALCEMGAVDIDPTSVFGVRPAEIDKMQEQQNKRHPVGGSKGETMPLQEKPLHVTPHHQFTPPTTMGATGIGSTRHMDVVQTPTSIGPKTSLFQTVQRPSNKSGVETGGGGAILPNQLQFDTPNLTPIPMQQDVSYAHPHSAMSTSDTFIDSRNPNTIQRAKHVAARLYYQPTPETPSYSDPNDESRYHHKMSTGVSSRRYLRGKSGLWSNSLLESSAISETPLRRGAGRPSDISTTRRPRALFLSENRNVRQNLRNRNNSDADADDLEDEENYRHRSTNGRPPLGGDNDDPEHSNSMMMTDVNEKPVAETGTSNQEIAVALEEDAMMEKHDGSVKKILELFCLMGAGYWRLCQVGFTNVQKYFLVETSIPFSLTANALIFWLRLFRLTTVPMQRIATTLRCLTTHPPQYWLGPSPRG